jgi:hypothetical protein
LDTLLLTPEPLRIATQNLERKNPKPQIQSAEKVDLEAEPLILHDGKYEPIHEGQQRAWVSLRRFVAVFAGWRSGKTEIGPPWLLREIQRKGAGDYAVIAPTYPIIDNKARPALKRFLNRVLGASAYHSSGDIWTLTPYGCLRVFGFVPEIETRILFRHGTNADAIEAFDGKGIWADEPGQMDDDLHSAMEARVSIGRHRILYTSRPFKFNWYVTKIWNRVMNKAHKRKPDAPEDIEVVNFSSLANPGFSQEEYDEQKLKLPGWVFDLKYNGIPTKPAGVIYGCFDRQSSCIPRVPLSDDWPRAAGHDFGNKNMAGLWAFKHPKLKSTTGRPSWVVYSSYLQGDAPIPVHAERFLYGCNPNDADEKPKERDPEKWRCAKRRHGDGFKPIAPMAWGGNLTNEDGWRFSFGSENYPIMEPPEGAVDKGIETVYGLVATREILFFEDLENVLGDVETYSYEVDDEGNVKLDQSGKPVIEQKSKWHRMDCLRALACGIAADSGETTVLRARSNQDEERSEDELSRRVFGKSEAGIRELHDDGGDESPVMVRGSATGGRRFVASKERCRAR